MLTTSDSLSLSPSLPNLISFVYDYAINRKQVDKDFHLREKNNILGRENEKHTPRNIDKQT